MKYKIARRILVMMASVGPVIGAFAAQAQQRIEDGRANDANNRVGSGGYNDPRPNFRRTVTGNQIVTGNVTGGKEFRGPVGYVDENEFRGPTASGNVSDPFIRSSAGVAEHGQIRAGEVRPYYGESRAVTLPPGFERLPGTGGYVQPRRTEGVDAGTDFGMGPPAIDLPKPGQLTLLGPIDPATNRRNMLMASPLFGVRQLPFDAQQEQMTPRIGGFEGEQPMLDPATIQRMREELRAPQAPTQGEPEGDQPALPADAPRNEGMAPQGLAPQGIAPQGMSQAIGGGALPADIKTGQVIRNQLIIEPHQQSTQLADLRKRYEARGAKTDVDAARQFNEERILLEQAEAEAKRTPDAGLPPQQIPAGPGSATGNGAGAPDAMTGRTLPGVGDLPAGGSPAPARSEEKKEPSGEAVSPAGIGITDYTKQPAEQPLRTSDQRPLQIKSLAAGISAQGLRELISNAERSAKEGKYTLALDYFDAAGEVAPNNALVTLGRAHVELGAAYYARAEGHLREALAKDPALLMGQYDLREMLGEERLQFVVNDLKEIAHKEQTQARPVFLLAYIAYNTGSERRAGEYLDMASQRAGGDDPIYRILRTHWTIPPATNEDLTPSPGTPGEGRGEG